MIEGKKLFQTKVTPELVEEIQQEFLDEGTSVNAIVKKYGIGWQTAALIRDGLHRLQQTAYVRCRNCGGMVLLPCRVCALRQSL